MQFSGTQIATLQKSLTEDQKSLLKYKWQMWARDKQLTPKGDWFCWLLLAGRGFGKTRTGAEWVRETVENSPDKKLRIALVAETAADVRDVMVEGESGILAISPPWNKPHYEPSKRQLTWPNGTIAKTYSAEEPDQLRGPQAHAAWCFIAGTEITTEKGDIPVQMLSVGDSVLTRRGLKKITRTCNRRTAVGTVKFSNGVILTGTPEHPVLTSYGWTMMSELVKGDTVCAINVSNTTEYDGTVTTADIMNIGALGQRGVPTATGYTGIFTEELTGKFQQAFMFITRMAMSLITKLTIWNAFPVVGTVKFIIFKGRYLKRIGKRCPSIQSLARIVGLIFSEKSKNQQGTSVENATTGGQIRKEPHFGTASTAARPSRVSTATTVVSVVSTWAHAGQDNVYNITVEDIPEYYANGILTHNCDEPAKWKYINETWANLLMGLRLGDNPQVCVTTTPRPLKFFKELMADDTTRITRGTTYENSANLPDAFFHQIIKRYEGTRIGRQELDAEILEDIQGALWTRSWFDRDRVKSINRDLLDRIVVAIDPAVTSHGESDETGITVSGKIGEEYYLLEDLSGRYSPTEWAAKASNAYDRWNADLIIGEANNGGDMIEAVLRNVAKGVNFKKVTASRGKIIRAEPIAALYEKGQVHHVGTFKEIEDQMAGFTLDYNRVRDGSPDRLDSTVWGLTELSGQVHFKWGDLI